MNPKIKAVLLSAIAFLFVLYGLSGVTSISPGEFGVVVKNVGSNRGMQPGGMATGWHWIDPFTYDVIVYNTRLHQEVLEDMPSNTKDGQPIKVYISFEVGLDTKQVSRLHEEIGPDWWDQIVMPAARSAIRTATSAELSDHIYTGEGRARVQVAITEGLKQRLPKYGIIINANLRDVVFENADYVHALEEKAKAAQRVVIEQRNAEAAAQTAIKVANQAEGEKQKSIKEAEANRERLRLEGEGERQKAEEMAKGNLALFTADAEGIRLKREAYGAQGAAAIVSVEWAKNLGPNVKVYGVPTGAPGTSAFMFDEALRGVLLGTK